LIYQCWLAGEPHQFELPEGVVQPKWKSNGSNVFGCGLLLDPEDKVAIFFTLNGQLMGESVLDVLKINKNKSHVYFLYSVNFNISQTHT
jgi:hypothetical protein